MGSGDEFSFGGQVPCHKFTPRAGVLGRSFSWEVAALHKASALVCHSWVLLSLGNLKKR